MPDLDRIVRCAIHPALGIARIGSSPDAFFLAPEVPGRSPDPGGTFKDGARRLKRQAARFRVFGFDAAGQVVGELTADEADIIWRVHLVNRKAAWYQFLNAMDLGELAMPAPRRNPAVADRTRLVIDPGARTISGRNEQGPAFRFDTGRFFDLSVELGELRTDEAGRLLVLGGRGVSRSLTGAPATTFANNDGWHDDTADGPVRATVSVAGRTLEADPAWIAVSPPNFAPALDAVVTMYDVLVDLFHRSDGWPAPDRPSFARDVRPILERLAGMEAVNRGAFVLFGPGSPSDLASPVVLDRLGDPSPESDAERRSLFAWFRDPEATVEDQAALPPLYGDLFGDFENRPGTGLAVTRLQHRLLRQWAEGDFSTDPVPAPPARLDDLPLEEQPHALDRAHLESCLGGPFHPGIELTWTLRLRSLWRAPFRLNVLSEGVEPRTDFGPVLAPDVALGPEGPFHASGPGMLTAFLGVPWQTDEASCDAGYEAGTYLPLPSYWATRVPNHVLPEQAFQRLGETSVPVFQRLKHLNHRPAWLRHFGMAYQRRINDMIRNWDELGLVVEREAPPDHATLGLPEKLRVESELELGLVVDDPTLDQVLRAEGTPAPLGMAPPAEAPPTHHRRRFGRGEV